MSHSASQLTLREVLRLRPVRTLWLAQIVSVFGDMLVLFAVLSDVSFRLHATPLQVSLISVFFMIPFAVIGPFAGVFVDRWNVKRTMIISDLLRALLVLGLVFSQGFHQLYLLLFLLSTVSTFFVPAQTVAIRTIVPAEGLLATNALMQQAFQLTRLISPAIATALFEWLGATPSYYFDSFSFLFSALLISTLLIPRKAPTENVPPATESKLQSLLADLLAGAKFIFTHATISFVILAMAAAMFAISCFGPLIAVYVRDSLNAAPRWFGIINAMVGVGMILGTLFVNKVAQSVPKSVLVLLGLLVMGISVFALASIGTITMAAVGTFGIGVGVTFVFVSTQTLIQQETPVELAGRVSSSLMAVLSLSQLVGLVVSGSMTQLIGIRLLFFASAVMLMLFAGVGYLRLPKTHPATAN